MLIRYFLPFVCMFFSVQSLFAQRIITGKLLDYRTKNPVEGATVIVYKGTSATSSNARGYFQLSSNDGDSLLISHPEYILAFIPVPEVDNFTLYIDKQGAYPEYLQGEAQLYSYLWANLKFPVSEITKRKEEVLFVELCVDSTGIITSCKALNDLGKKFEKATIPVFEAIPGRWSASHQSSKFIFPVLFKIGLKETDIEVPMINIPEGKMMTQIIVYADL